MKKNGQNLWPYAALFSVACVMLCSAVGAMLALQQGADARAPIIIHVLALVSAAAALVLLVLHLRQHFLLKESEASGKKSRASLDNLSANIPGGVFCLRPDRRLTLEHYNPGFSQLIGYSAAELEKKSNSFAALVHPADREAFTRAAAELSPGQSLSCHFRLISKSGATVWLNVRGSAGTCGEGNACISCVAMDITRLKTTQVELSETQRTLQNFLEVIPGGAYCYDADTLKPIYVSMGMLELLGTSEESFFNGFSEGLAGTVHESDRAEFVKNLVPNGGGDALAELEYRTAKQGGSVRWIAEHRRFSREENRTLCYCVAVDQTQRRQLFGQLLDAKKDITSLIDTLPGGIAKMRLDDGYSVVYANDGFYSLIGYERQDFEDLLEGKIRPIILPEDLAYIDSYARRAQEGDKLHVEFRVRKRDSSVSWLLLSAGIVRTEDGGLMLLCMLSNNDEAKIAQEQLLREKERYRIVSNLSDDVIFEYDERTKTAEFSEKYSLFFGRSKVQRNYIENLDKGTVLHKNDKPAFREFYRNFLDGKKTLSLELRTLNAEGNYVWCLIQARTVFEDGRPVKLLGRISNIDDIKSQTRQLIDQTQRDPLTGLYNKVVTHNLIAEALRSLPPGQTHAVIMLDIDDFKYVNDTLGHARGDETLKSIAAAVRSPFRSSDIVGRIGGDEFMIFMKNVSPQTAEEKARTLSGLLRRSTDSGKHLLYSVSMGVIVFESENALSFDELFKIADQAMYRAKDLGKNKYVLQRLE